MPFKPNWFNLLWKHHQHSTGIAGCAVRFRYRSKTKQKTNTKILFICFWRKKWRKTKMTLRKLYGTRKKSHSQTFYRATMRPTGKVCVFILWRCRKDRQLYCAEICHLQREEIPEFVLTSQSSPNWRPDRIKYDTHSELSQYPLFKITWDKSLPNKIHRGLAHNRAFYCLSTSKFRIWVAEAEISRRR